MAEDLTFTQERFDLLLDWLDRDRDAAAVKYETIRKRLVQVFLGRGCYEADDLADVTIDRVTKKLPGLAHEFQGNPSAYFYGVANKIHLEWLRKQKKVGELNFDPQNNKKNEDDDAPYGCLEKCLTELPAGRRSLILEYYQGERSARIENRKRMAEVLHISDVALHIRASRIRSALKDCVHTCVAQG